MSKAENGTRMNFKPGEWAYSNDHEQPCQVIDAQALWGSITYRVWLSRTDRTVQAPESDLSPLVEKTTISADELIYRATAARIAETLAQDVLLAPLESSVIPLPHQLHALSRALSGEQIRYLLADEVGLGKTIEAGMILRELKLRGLVSRILIVTPKGLTSQWVDEMQTHFREEFTLVNANDLSTLRSLARERNPWALLDQVVCSMDAVKPLETRRGWSREQIAAHNHDRFDSLLAAGWDLVIVDEAHRLGGSSEQIARYRLGQGLASAAPYMLLLSATPHQGKSDAFRRILNLIDDNAFPDDVSLTRPRVQPYVIRTEKRQAIDAEGKPLFKPRFTHLVAVAWEQENVAHRQQSTLYDAVSDYVREGYNRALREKRNYVGFLMVLMQRLVTSSTAAIRTTLERRQAVLDLPFNTEDRLHLPPPEEWNEFDAQEQAELLASAPGSLMQHEKAEVNTLLDLARRCEAAGPDAKAAALLNTMYDLQRTERNPHLKVLIFTEFVPTQEMLRRFLEERGFVVAILNGSMALGERQHAQRHFAGTAQILVSTDAGGEGLNLQFCHVVMNYDIPWNPMRLEQRIGRVDRIGQEHPVYAQNFVLADTVEYRVREVLEEKLALIQEEFGVDKTGDVLDSGEAGTIFEALYMASLLDPQHIIQVAERTLREVREQAKVAQESRNLLGATAPLDPAAAQRINNHPLPNWVERMTIHYLRAHGGRADATGRGWLLHWPDGTRLETATFHLQRDQSDFQADALTVENEKIRALIDQVEPWTSAHVVPVMTLKGLPDGVSGIWSLWQIHLSAHTVSALGAEQARKRKRMLPLFIHDDGRILTPTARRIWDLLLSHHPRIHDTITGEAAVTLMTGTRQHAETQGQPIYQQLQQDYLTYVQRQREKTEFALAARRRALERIGLPEVRAFRLAALTREEQTWQVEQRKYSDFVADLVPLLLVRITGASL